MMCISLYLLFGPFVFLISMFILFMNYNYSTMLCNHLSAVNDYMLYLLYNLTNFMSFSLNYILGYVWNVTITKYRLFSYPLLRIATAISLTGFFSNLTNLLSQPIPLWILILGTLIINITHRLNANMIFNMLIII